MGGQWTELRGRTKEDVYAEYVQWAEDNKDWLYPDLGAPEPDDEEACMEAMEQDLDTGEWVLRFHAHT